MKPSTRALLFAFLSAFAVGPLAASAECFSMYDAKNALVFQSSTSPIDLSRPVSEEMARRYPSRALVIATSTSCTEGLGGGGTSRFIGPEESGALYGSTTSTNAAPAADAENVATPRVVRRVHR